MKCLITGGAGFIGSNLAERLVADGHEVTVYDSLATGFEENLRAFRDRLRVVRGDIRDLETLETAVAGHDTVFHLAANADVKGGVTNTRIDLDVNTIGTWNVLEACRRAGVERIAFSSSAVVYGEPEVFPTPEDVTLRQTSLYGASKLAGEAMLEAFCEAFGMRAWIFRFVSFIGRRYSHGVLYDFYLRLREDPRRLTILGDGKQSKSYLDVEDGVGAILHAMEHSREAVSIINLGHDDHVCVVDVADAVCRHLGLGDVEYAFTGGTRGWIGDSPFVHLDTTRMKALGWRPTISIADGIARTLDSFREHPWLLARGTNTADLLPGPPAGAR